MGMWEMGKWTGGRNVGVRNVKAPKFRQMSSSSNWQRTVKIFVHLQCQIDKHIKKLKQIKYFINTVKASD